MLIKLIKKGQLYMGTVCLSFFFVATLLQIFTRHLGIPMIWTEEVANYSFIWSVFMGASVMVYHKGHFRFELMAQYLNKKSLIYLDILIDVFLLLFNLAIFYYGVLAAKTFWNYRWVTIPGFKMGYTWLCLPIMGATMSIYSLKHINDGIRKITGRSWNSQ